MKPSPEFVGNLIIVLITAALIPLIFRFIDDRKSTRQREEDDRKSARQREEDDLRQRKQMVFEAELSRQSKVIDAQAQFMDQLAALLWEYQLMAIAVSYYHQFNLGDRYQVASKQYLDNAGTLLGRIRAEISRSLHLSSKKSYEKLRQLYYNRLLELDKHLTILIENPNRNEGHNVPSWRTFIKDAVEVLPQEVDNVILDLAKEFDLAGQFSPPAIDSDVPEMASA